MKENKVAPTTRKVLARNILSNGTGLAVDVIAAFILTPLIVTNLGLAVYGVWSLLIGIIGYMGIADLGVRGSTGRYINMHLARGEHTQALEVLSTSITLLMGLSALIILASSILGIFIGDIFPQIDPAMHKDILFLLPSLAIVLGLEFQSSVRRQVIQAYERFDLINLIQILSTLIRFVLVVVLLKLGLRLDGLIIANLVAGLFNYLGSVFFASYVDPKLDFRVSAINFSRIRELAKFGVAVFFVRSNWQLIAQLDQILLMTFFGPEATGSYSIARIFTSYAALVKEKIGSVLFPSTQKMGGVGDMAGLRRIFVQFFALTTSVGVLVNVGFIIFGHSFILLWMGQGYDQAASLLAMLAVAGLISSIASNSAGILFSLGKLRANIIISSLMSILNVTISLILVIYSDLGVYAIAVGTVISVGIIHGLVYPFVINSIIGLGYRIYLARILLPLGCIVALSFSAFSWISDNLSMVSWVQFIYSIMAAGLIYVVLVAPMLYFTFRSSDKE